MKIPSTNEEPLSSDDVEQQPISSIENSVLNSVFDNEHVKEDEKEFGSNFDQATAKLLKQPNSLSQSKKKSVVGRSVKPKQFSDNGCQLFTFESVTDMFREKRNREKYSEQKMYPGSDTVFNKIQYSIINGLKIMIIMRGCPGSGKSTLAKSIIKSTLGDDYKQYIFSTDDFFVRQFTFNPARLSEAHAWNQQRVIDAVKKGKSPIIVDNTNLELWEMKPYVSVAVAHGYFVEPLEPFTAWRYNVGELSKKNIHNVSRQHIKNMMDRFLKNINSSTLLKLLNFNYSPSNMPPQFVKGPLVSHQRKSCRTRPRRRKVPKSASGDICHATSESEKETEILLSDKNKFECSVYNCEMKAAQENSDISSSYDHSTEKNTANDISENDSNLDNSDFMINLTTSSVEANIHEHSLCTTKISGESCQFNTNESFENVYTIESFTKFQNATIPCALNLDDYCCQQIDGLVKEGKCKSFTEVDTTKFEECNVTHYDKVDMSQLEKKLDIKLEEHMDSQFDAELKSSHQVNDAISESEESEACLKLHNLKLDGYNTNKFELAAANYEGKSSLLNERHVFKETRCDMHMKSQKLKLHENVESQLDQAEKEANLQCSDFNFPIQDKDIPSYFIDDFQNAASNTSSDSFQLSAIEKINDFNDSQNGLGKDVGLEKESIACIDDNALNSSEEVHKKININRGDDARFNEDIISTDENSVSNEIIEIIKLDCLDEDKLFVKNLNADLDKVNELNIKLCNNCATDKCESEKESPGFENSKKLNQYHLSQNILKTTLKNNTCNLKNIEDIATWKNESLDLQVQESSEIIENVINVANENLLLEREEDCQNLSNCKEIIKCQSEIESVASTTSLELPATERNLDFYQQTDPNSDKRGVKKDVSEKISDLTDNCSVETRKNVVAKCKLEQNTEEKVCDWASDDKLYSWDSSDDEDKPVPDKKIFAPRPARTSRRPVLVYRAPEDQNRFQREPEYVPNETEMWNTVENPLASWEENVTKVSVQSVGTNTHHTDFITLHKLNNGEAFDPMQVKVIHSSNKQKVAQNRTYVSNVASIPKRIMLDKSTMTSIEEYFPRGLEELSSVFPNISQEYLKEIYDYCNGDFTWTVDLIMEQDPQNSDNFISLSMKPGESAIQFNENLKPDKVINASPKKLPKKSKNKISSEESQELKKQLERNFVINDDYYSDHTLFLRNIRHPENIMQSNLEDFQIPSEVVHVDDSPSSSEDTSEEEGIDMKLDTEFVKKLCTVFDGPSLSINGKCLQISVWLILETYYLLWKI